MVKKIHLSFLLIMFFIGTNAKAQLCSDIPIVLIDDEFVFSASDFEAFGDSMISFNLINNHPTEYYAYPQAKLVPVNELPSGMELAPFSVGWTVFTSVWNVGETMNVKIYYDNSLPIPLDYTINFTLWLNNLYPVIDSCYFDQGFSLNLNPSATPLNNINSNKTINLSPNPVSTNGILYVDLKAINNQLDNTYSIYTLAGNLVATGRINSNNISISGLPSGMYHLQIFNNKEVAGFATFTIQ